jgi:hypothetical protein
MLCDNKLAAGPHRDNKPRRAAEDPLLLLQALRRLLLAALRLLQAV